MILPLHMRIFFLPTGLQLPDTLLLGMISWIIIGGWTGRGRGRSTFLTQRSGGLFWRGQDGSVNDHSMKAGTILTSVTNFRSCEDGTFFWSDSSGICSTILTRPNEIGINYQRFVIHITIKKGGKSIYLVIELGVIFDPYLSSFLPKKIGLWLAWLSWLTTQRPVFLAHEGMTLTYLIRRSLRPSRWQSRRSQIVQFSVFPSFQMFQLIRAGNFQNKVLELTNCIKGCRVHFEVPA